MTRRERRRKLRDLREAAREARGASRLLPTRPYARKDVAEDEMEARAGATGTIPEPSRTPDAQSPPARGQPAPGDAPQTSGTQARERGPSQAADFSGLPWTASGPFSLDPLSRHAARSDLDWRR